MEFMKWWTRSAIDIAFSHCTPKEKRDNLKFIHGMVVLFLAIVFIFSPSRSFTRYGILGLYVTFASLYATLGDCWVSRVEQDLFKTKRDPPGVLDPILTLIGIPKNTESRETTTRIAYLFTIILLLFLSIRDLFGVY